MNNLLLN